ncbi:hypothetical protein P4O66_001175 [Electrophorus voltai]|uniref:Lipid-binding serum glycoprotein N-terminal domain-containing protein n=1 Tax=Electrophorus voltai TaxID=2609070 RepID=A0AAD8ZAQ2_9TELE|nr:hypothetical protein P4O66_001175 [Electrophorus voltai]
MKRRSLWRRNWETSLCQRCMARKEASSIPLQKLNLIADLSFQPTSGLLFEVQNSSIALNFQRRILYWFFYDEGAINASADGVNIHTTLHLTKDVVGRLKIANVSCDASIAKMKAKFGGTFGYWTSCINN